jgi:arsenite-transporting ATPase
VNAFAQPLLERQILFFGGKGGVGKTTLAAMYGLLAAERGRRTLLVSTDPAHSIGDVLHVSLGVDPTEFLPNLWGLEIDAAHEADRYIADVKDRIADVTPPRLVAEVERQIDIARVSPGAEEAAVFDRFTRLMDLVGAEYDRLLFDTAPLGYTLRLLSLPEHMGAWMDALVGRRKKLGAVGRMWRTVAGAASAAREVPDPVLLALEERRSRFLRARALMTDDRRAAFAFVTTAERLALLETERGLRALGKHGIPVGAVILNRLQAAGAVIPDVERWFGGHRVFSIPEAEEPEGPEGLRRLAAHLPSLETTA